MAYIGLSLYFSAFYKSFIWSICFEILVRTLRIFLDFKYNLLHCGVITFDGEILIQHSNGISSNKK